MLSSFTRSRYSFLYIIRSPSNSRQPPYPFIVVVLLHLLWEVEEVGWWYSMESSSAKMEELTSGASGRIIPVLRNMGGTIPSYQTIKQSLALFYSTFLCFFLILLRPRSSSSSSSSSLLPRSSSTPAPVSLKTGLRRRSMSARFRVWSDEEDAMRRRALAEAVKMVPAAETDNGNSGVYDCEWHTSLFLGARSDSLFYRSWFPATTGRLKGIIVIIHGLNEHSGRYAHFAKQLTSCQFGVYAMDWIGHGGSDGLHGYVPSLDHVVADTGAFLEKVKLENPGIPCFLFGHSTGGAVVLKAASYPRIEQMLEGIILTSPALRVKPAHPVVAIMAPLFSMVAPRFQFKGANKRGIPVTRDPVQLHAKYADPLVYTGPIRVRTGHEILRISSHLTKNLKSVTVPFFILHGTADRVTDPLASRDLYEEATSKVKDIRLYDGFLHDLLFEPERKEIGQDIIDWMEKKLKLSCCEAA